MRRITGHAAMSLVGLVFAGFVVAACGSGGSDSGPDPTARSTIPIKDDHDALCDLLEVPLSSMAAKDLTFKAVVSSPASQDRGVGAMVLLLLPKAHGDVGKFEPVLSFLAKRGALEVQDGHPTLPAASDAVVRNAAALDAFVADGGCG